jgi:capsular exopolysaccharide synthesis family protein
LEYLNPPSDQQRLVEATNPVAAIAPAAPPPKTGGGASLDINSLFFRILRNWWMLLLGLGLGYLAAKLYLRYRDIDYTVSATVQISDEDSQDFQNVIGPNFATLNSGVDNMANEIQLMKSRSLLLEVVESLDLDMNIYTDGRVRNINLYKSTQNPIDVIRYEPDPDAYKQLLILEVIDRDRFAFGDEEQLDTFRFNLPFVSRYGRFTIARNADAKGGMDRILLEFRNPDRVARTYADRLSIKPVGTTDLLTMNLEDEVPERAKDVIIGVIEAYDSITVNVKNRTSDRTIAFLNERIDEYSNDLSTVEQRAENFIRDRNLLVDIPTNLGIELNQFRETEIQIAELRLQINAIENLAEYLQSNQNDNQVIPYTANVENMDVSGLIQRYNELLIRRKELLATASAENPVVKATEEPLRELEDNILDAISRIQRELEQQVTRLDEENVQILNSIREVPGQRRELLSIEREQQIKEQLYLYLLQKREETGLTQAVTNSGMRLVEPPLTEGSNQPDSSQVYLAGLLIGLLLPVGALTVAEILDNTVRSAESIKQLTNAPLLGSLAENKNNDYIVVQSDSRSPIAEMFRMLRTNLRFLTAGNKNQTMLVTSSMSGEGKTFVCINLGVSLALAGHRVLIIGMDLRKPKLGQYLGVENEQQVVGLSNYLVQSAELSTIIRTYEGNENLDYITSGVIPPNPAEMIMMDRNQDMIRMLKKEYDYILIDTPPIALVTDALLLSDLADATLFVTRYGYTKRNQLFIIDELQEERKLRNIAVILNGVKSGRGYGYGGYGYGSGYGYGYYQ